MKLESGEEQAEGEEEQERGRSLAHGLFLRSARFKVQG